MEPPPPSPSRAPAFAAAALALLAVAWGGATETAGQAAVMAGLGLLFVCFPVRRLPDRWFAVAALGLLLLTLTAWLPAAWFPSPLWRAPIRELGITLPPTRSPQPALSLDGVTLLGAGLAWIVWLTSRSWNDGPRTAAARSLAAGLAVIGAAALAAWTLRFPIPWWHPHSGFGPFPNRNQTGHVFALGGLLALGCLAEQIRRHWKRAWPWGLCVVVLTVALVTSYSRGAVLLLFGGAGLWCLGSAWKRRSPQLLTLGASGIIVAGSVVLLTGHSFADRVVGRADASVAFRPLIWRDTLRLIEDSPWLGAGLENFHALFPFYRSASVIQQGILHPESDWLWLAAEAGWPAVLLALFALLALFRGVPPFARGSQRRLRGAACAAAVAAAFHAAVDVPGHRLGSVMIALFALALARRDPPVTTPSRLVALSSRAAGLGFLALAFVWSSNHPDHLARADALVQHGHFREAESEAARGLARAPLDWTGYFARGAAEAGSGRFVLALADFRRARTLEPHYAQIPYEEGRFWAQLHQPELALQAWEESLRRLPPGQDAELFSSIVAAAPDTPAFRLRLLDLMPERPLLQIEWFRLVLPNEALLQADRLTPVADQAPPKERALFYQRLREIRPPAPE